VVVLVIQLLLVDLLEVLHIFGIILLLEVEVEHQHQLVDLVVPLEEVEDLLLVL
jgi:hypothetical protein